jgi:hypothetical protein
MSIDNNYYEMKLAEARNLLGPLGPESQELLSIKLRPVDDIGTLKSAYAYPDDYKLLRQSLDEHGFQRLREGWVSRGKAEVYGTPTWDVFLIAEHETGPEIVFAVAGGVVLANILIGLLKRFISTLQQNDLAGKRYHKAGAVSVEVRNENGGQQIVTISLPASVDQVEAVSGDFQIKLSRYIQNYKGSTQSVYRSLVGAAPEPIVILFLGANPSDTTRLSLTQEVQAIDMILRSTDYRERFKLEQQWEVQAKEIPGKIMRFKPNIVHFSGHGSIDGRLIFQDSEGRSMPVKQESLTTIFRLLNDKVRCVVLNACFSESQAKAISQQIDVVVGMSHEIGDSDAMAFAGAFYEALGYGKDVGTSFNLAKLSISLSGLSDEYIPQLLLRSGVDVYNYRFTVL